MAALSTEAMARRLAGVELFAGLRPSQLVWLARVGELQQLADGDVLFEEGDADTAFFVLLSGDLLISTMLGGHEQILGRHSSGNGHPGGARGEPDQPFAASQFTGEVPLRTGQAYAA